MTTDELLAREASLRCQYQQWNGNLRNLSFMSEVIIVPDDVVDYLHEDGVFLPEESAAFPSRTVPQVVDYDSDDDWSEDLDNDGHANDWQQTFPKFAESIQQAIQRLGGRVLPKLNWSCPIDATWLSLTNTLACTSPEQVMLLLKGSDRISHDLDAIKEMNTQGGPHVPVTLTLRKFYDLLPGREFRCFVCDGRLLGVSQRDTSQHFPQVLEDLPRIRQEIWAFHTQHIAPEMDLPSYTYDIYITSKWNIRLVDFNPLGGTTQPLLFTWEELGLAPLPASQSTPHSSEPRAAEPAKEPCTIPASSDTGAAPCQTFGGEPDSRRNGVHDGSELSSSAVVRPPAAVVNNGLKAGASQSVSPASPASADASRCKAVAPGDCSESCTATALAAVGAQEMTSDTRDSCSTASSARASGENVKPWSAGEQHNAVSAGCSERTEGIAIAEGVRSIAGVGGGDGSSSSGISAIFGGGGRVLTVDDSGAEFELRIVQVGGGTQVGQRMATAMPFDMLMLQDSMDTVMSRMQQETA